MKILSAFLFLMLISCAGAYAVGIALYIGQPNDGWYSPDQMLEDADKIVAAFPGAQAFKDDDLEGLRSWAEVRVNNGQMDIIWLNGCTPSVLYPNPNVEPDGSLAERWLDGGNMIINVADWFGYCTYETGARGVDNAAAGAENMLDLPGIIRSANGTGLDVTAAGNEYLPSIGNSITTDRPIVGSAVVAPWEIAEVFGGAAGGDMDPAVIHNTQTGGYMAFINQSVLANSVDRAQVTIEFIGNWVVGLLGVSSVEPDGKITGTWGDIKK